MTRWEYRVATVKEDKYGYPDDGDLSQRLTNLSQHDWEIFAIRPLDYGQVRLYMKRPATQD